MLASSGLPEAIAQGGGLAVAAIVLPFFVLVFVIVCALLAVSKKFFFLGMAFFLVGLLTWHVGLQSLEFSGSLYVLSVIGLLMFVAGYVLKMWSLDRYCKKAEPTCQKTGALLTLFVIYFIPVSILIISFAMGLGYVPTRGDFRIDLSPSFIEIFVLFGMLVTLLVRIGMGLKGDFRTSTMSVRGTTPFFIGRIGAAMSGVAAFLLSFTSFVGASSLLFGYALSLGWGLYNYTAGLIVLIFFAIGLFLTGFGYRGIKTNCGIDAGTAGFVLCILSSLFFLADSFDYYYIVRFLPYIIFPVFGITQIVCGIAQIRLRRFAGDSGSGMVTGILLIVSGALTASFLLSSVGMLLFSVAEAFVFDAFKKTEMLQTAGR